MLQGDTDPVFLSRTALAASACTLGIVYMLVLIISTIATRIVPSYDGVTVRWLTYDVGWPTVFVLFIAGAFGLQRLYAKFQCFLGLRWQYHQARQRALLHYLHARMIQVVPSVHLSIPLPDNGTLLDQLIEVSDARRLLWSYVSNNGQLTARIEARELSKLLQQGTILGKAGKHKVPPLPKETHETMAYNLAVARTLKRLERIQKHELS
jgi:hypothetical protein